MCGKFLEQDLMYNNYWISIFFFFWFRMTFWVHFFSAAAAHLLLLAWQAYSLLCSLRWFLLFKGKYTENPYLLYLTEINKIQQKLPSNKKYTTDHEFTGAIGQIDLSQILCPFTESQIIMVSDKECQFSSNKNDILGDPIWFINSFISPGKAKIEVLKQHRSEQWHTKVC